jgi:hypothetical protein
MKTISKRILIFLAAVGGIFIIIIFFLSAFREEIFSHSINQKVRVKNLEWRISKVEVKTNILEPKEKDWLGYELGWEKYCKAEKGKFIIIEGEVKNINKEPVIVFNPQLIDSKNRKYWPYENASYCTSPWNFLRSDLLSPGEMKQFVLIYKIPEDSFDLKLKVSEGTTDPALQNQILLYGESARNRIGKRTSLIKLGIHFPK